MKSNLSKGTLLLLITIISALSINTSCNRQKSKNGGSDELILAVNAYSFSDLRSLLILI